MKWTIKYKNNAQSVFLSWTYIFFLGYKLILGWVVDSSARTSIIGMAAVNILLFAILLKNKFFRHWLWNIKLYKSLIYYFKRKELQGVH